MKKRVQDLCRWESTATPRWNERVFVKLTADDGVVGYGEIICHTLWWMDSGDYPVNL